MSSLQQRDQEQIFGRTENEDGVEIGTFTAVLGVMNNLFKFLGSTMVGHIRWEVVCLITALISPVPLLLYTLFILKEEKVKLVSPLKILFFK